MFQLILKPSEEILKYIRTLQLNTHKHAKPLPFIALASFEQQ